MGDLNNQLQDAGNMIAALNSPLVEGTYTVGQQFGKSGDLVGVDISKADPTGTVDITSERFKRLEAARMQGMISQQRAQLEADVILRQAITKAPGFADKLRASAALELGFNPSGAALEQLYLSGPDLNKTVRQTAQQKELEDADSYVAAGLFPDRATAFHFIQESKVQKQQNVIDQGKITRGQMAAPQITSAATQDFSNNANGLLAGMIAELNTTGTIADPQFWNAQISLVAQKTKDQYRAAMASSEIAYPQDAYDSMIKSVDASLKTYTDMASNNDFIKVMKDHRDGVFAVAQMQAVEMAPDLFAVYQVSGNAGVEAYLKVMQLASGNPKQLAELAKSRSDIAYMVNLSNKLPEVSKAITGVLTRGIGPMVRAGAVTKDTAEKVTRSLAEQCTANGDPTTCAAALEAGKDLELKNVSVSTAAQVPGSFTTATEASKVFVKNAATTNFEIVKDQLSTSLAGSKWKLGFDTNKKAYTIVPREDYVAANWSDAFRQPQGDAFAYNDKTRQYGSPLLGSPGPAVIRPNVDAQLEVLNHQIQGLATQPDWSTYVFDQTTFDPTTFTNQTINEINLRAVDKELQNTDVTSGYTVKEQVDLYHAIEEARKTGDRTKLDEQLKALGLEDTRQATSAPVTEQVAPPVTRLDAGVYKDDVTGEVFSVGADGSHTILSGPNSGKIIRGPDFGDAGLGVVQLPVGDEASPILEVLKNAAFNNGVDPNVFASLSFQESTLNPRAQNPESSAGGLTGLIDATAAGLGVTNKYDPVQNAEGGAAYLNAALKRTNGDYREALALYHGGINKDQPDAADYAYADQILSRLKK
jgi:hypothetical protein